MSRGQAVADIGRKRTPRRRKCAAGFRQAVATVRRRKRPRLSVYPATVRRVPFPANVSERRASLSGNRSTVRRHHRPRRKRTPPPSASRPPFDRGDRVPRPASGLSAVRPCRQSIRQAVTPEASAGSMPPDSGQCQRTPRQSIRQPFDRAPPPSTAPEANAATIGKPSAVRPWRPCAASRFRPVSGSTVPPVYPASRHAGSVRRKYAAGFATIAGNAPETPLQAVRRLSRVRARLKRAVRFASRFRPFATRARIRPPVPRRIPASRGDRWPEASGLSAIPANIGTPPPSEADNRSTAPPEVCRLSIRRPCDRAAGSVRACQRFAARGKFKAIQGYSRLIKPYQTLRRAFLFDRPPVAASRPPFARCVYCGNENAAPIPASRPPVCPATVRRLSAVRPCAPASDSPARFAPCLTFSRTFSPFRTSAPVEKSRVRPAYAGLAVFFPAKIPRQSRIIPRPSGLFQPCKETKKNAPAPLSRPRLCFPVPRPVAYFAANKYHQ